MKALYKAEATGDTKMIATAQGKVKEAEEILELERAEAVESAAEAAREEVQVRFYTKDDGFDPTNDGFCSKNDGFLQAEQAEIKAAKEKAEAEKVRVAPYSLQLSQGQRGSNLLLAACCFSLAGCALLLATRCLPTWL